MSDGRNSNVFHEGSITDVEAPQKPPEKHMMSPGSAQMHGSMQEHRGDNPFIYNLYSQAMWSSAKSKDSENRMSFGGL